MQHFWPKGGGTGVQRTFITFPKFHFFWREMASQCHQCLFPKATYEGHLKSGQDAFSDPNGTSWGSIPDWGQICGHFVSCRQAADPRDQNLHRTKSDHEGPVSTELTGSWLNGGGWPSLVSSGEALHLPSIHCGYLAIACIVP